MVDWKQAEARLPEKLMVIELDDLGIPGGEMQVSLRLPFGLWEQLAALGTSRKLDELRPLFVAWGLRAWNLTDHAGPIPPTEEGLRRLEGSEQMAVVAAWLRGVVQPPGPLSPPSGSTEPSGAKSPRNSRKRSSATSS